MIVRTRFSILLITATSLAGPLANGESRPIPIPDDHAREELGLNRYTTPAIDSVLAQLEQLKPFPYESIRRQPPAGPFPNRVQLAMNFGALIADGFVMVAAENNEDAELLGRTLVRYARSLGVGDPVIRHGQSLSELAKAGRWKNLRTELTSTQRELERAMMDLRDEEIAHLISLGGWLRALEITSGITARGYTPQRAALLIRPDLLNYFIERVRTLNPSLRQVSFIKDLSRRLEMLDVLFALPSPPSRETVGRIRDAAAEANRVISEAKE